MSRNAAALRTPGKYESSSTTVSAKPSTVPRSINISVTVNWDASHTSITGLTVSPSGPWLKHGGTVAWTVSGLQLNQVVTIAGTSKRPLDVTGTETSGTLSLSKVVVYSPIPAEDTSLGDDKDSRVVDYTITISGQSSGTAGGYLVIDTSGPPPMMMHHGSHDPEGGDRHESEI